LREDGAGGEGKKGLLFWKKEAKNFYRFAARCRTCARLMYAGGLGAGSAPNLPFCSAADERRVQDFTAGVAG